MLTETIKSNLRITYYLENTDFVNDILREIRGLVQEELANRIQDRLEEIVKLKRKVNRNAE